MMDAGAQHIIDASAEVGVDATFSRTAQEYWRKAVAATTAAGKAVSTYELMRGRPIRRRGDSPDYANSSMIRVSRPGSCSIGRWPAGISWTGPDPSAAA